MVDEEEAVGIVFLFDLDEAGVVCAPVGTLKIGFEEVALRDVRSASGGDRSEFVHAAVYGVRGGAALRGVGLVI